MSGIQGEHKHPHPKERNYGAFQNEVYRRGMFENIMPTVTTDSNKLESQAKEIMNRRSFNYVAGGAGERATMDANRLAFRTWKVSYDTIAKRLTFFMVRNVTNGLVTHLAGTSNAYANDPS